MTEGKTSVSQGTSYTQIGEFWDHHDLGEFWDQTEAVEFEVDPAAAKSYYAIERHLSEHIRVLARARGVSAETLLNLWVQERLQREQAG